MRKSILIPWLIIVISSSGMLFYSSVAEIDAYHTVFNFKLQVYDVTVIQNITGNFESLKVSSSIYNPSSLFSFKLNMINLTVILNEQEAEYLGGPKYPLRTISPGESSSVILTYPVVEQDLDFFDNAINTGSWNWTFYIRVNLNTIILGDGQYDRSQSFQA
ncbi:MAG: hypothetical protein ACW99Q_14715 [Candidatus Kariarchaeaceae archaeon]|jgi:hypothetical protein